MDLLNVMDHQSLRLWLAQATVLFFLIAGVALLAAGLGLILNSAAALRIFGGMNRWVSMRGASKPLEIPRDTRQAVQKYRYWFAAVFILGGAFALFGLLARFDAGAVVFSLNLRTNTPALAETLVDSVRWMLVAGNLVGVALGILLAFFPAAIVALEARGSQWYSERKITKGVDNMSMKLDPWVAAYPRIAGGIIVFIALALIGAFGLMLPRVW